MIISGQHKNVFNKICAQLKKTKVCKEGIEVSMTENVMVSDKLNCNLNLWFRLQRGKFYTLVDRDRVYVVWDPEINFEKEQYSYFKYGMNRNLEGDQFAECLYTFFDDYYVDRMKDELNHILLGTGVDPEELIKKSDSEVYDILRRCNGYQKLKEFYDFYRTTHPRYLLQDEVHKRLSNRNVIPIMFWDENKDEISYPSDRFWGDALMATKYRSTVSLDTFITSDFKRRCDYAILYTPIVAWGKLLLKNPISGQEVEKYLR